MSEFYPDHLDPPLDVCVSCAQPRDHCECMNNITCPHCNGKRRLYAFWDGVRPEDSGSGYVDCSTCKGNGSISQAHMDRITEGERRRNDRVSRGVSLNEEARKFGITPAQLSALERGKQ